MLKLALLSDIHYGPDRGTKKGSLAPQLFTEFCDWLDIYACDLLVDLGDRISDVDLETDRILAQEVASWFHKIDKPKAHLIGNHDVEKLTVAENEKLLGCSFNSWSIDMAGYHLVFWNASARLDAKAGFALPARDVDWLEANLTDTTLPTIVFSHVPLDNGSMQGNFYFEAAYPHHAHYPELQAQSAREVLERSKKVILCVNGHAHWNAYHCIDGIHYVTIPSLTESFPTYPAACRAWASLTLASDIHLTVHGNLPIEYRLPIKSSASEHWLNIHKSYAPQVELPQ